jgi:S1-C subfamily serine protease
MRMDGQTIADAEELVRLIGRKRSGQQVRLRVLRNGQARTLNVTLASRPKEGRFKR